MRLTDAFPVGVLLVNLGTPDSPSVPDVRRYLREFLSDPRVIDLPALGNFLLVNGIIAPFRAPKSAKIYRELWQQRGSPLKFYGEDITQMVQQRLGEGYCVRLAMRYQQPSITASLEEFRQAGLRKIVVVPFFPQYASATTGSVYQQVMDIVGGWQTIPAVSFTNTFFDHPLFIRHFSEAARRYLAGHSFNHFLFSYHGVPERQIYRSDPTGRVCQLGSCCDTLRPDNQHCYRAQCFATTRLLAEALGLQPDQYSTAFQSRLGRDPWIQPYTEDRVKQLAASEHKNVLAFSPAFVSDCLETTIEVGEEYRELFEANGGGHWQLVESLNDSPLFADLIVDLVKNH